MSLLEKIYRYLFPRPMFSVLSRYFPKQASIQVLDVGCGNHSPSLFKRHFPNCIYAGLDRVMDYNLDPEDKACLDHFFLIDLNEADWSPIPEERYDLIVMAHVIEHILHGEEVLSHLWKKLKRGGYLYIETPSERSLYLPSMEGTLNFFDDPTHVRLYPAVELCNYLLRMGAKMQEVGIVRSYRRLIFMPLLLVLHWVFRGTVRRAFLWRDITGFAYYLVAQKPAQEAHNSPIK